MAASTAAQALLELKNRTSSSPSDEKAWYRLLPRPSVFDPDSREAELAQWREWSWSVEQYLASMDPEFAVDLARIRKNSNAEVDMSIMDESEKKRCTFLYGLYASLLRQRPLMMLKKIEGSNGFEAFRQLVLSMEPVSRNRSLGILNAIMSWPQFSMKGGSVVAQLLKLEAAFREYERTTGEALQEELRFAVVFRCVTGQLKTWLQLQVQDGTSYADLREHIVRYDKATLKWTDAMCLASEPSHETVPMDVDRIEKGKKGKGKPKGMNNKGKQTKGDSKGDGKAKFQSSKGKGSQQQGGKQNPGFGQWNQTGYQQAGGKQSVQNQIAGKQSDKGKGWACYTCGRTGHLARDCWNAKGKGGCGTHSQVRSVEEGTGDAGVSSTNDATAHENLQQFPRSISQNVRRVQQPVVFDMRSADLQFDSLNLEVRAVFFDMSQDDFLEEYMQPEDLPNHDLREGIGLIEPCVEACKFDSFWECDLEVSDCSTCSTTCLCNNSLRTDSVHEKISCASFGGIDLDMYEVVTVDSRRVHGPACFETCWFPSSLRGSCCFPSLSLFPPAEHDHLEPVTVRAVSELFDSEDVSIIVDSGSDATVIPSKYAFCGKPVRSSGELRDCQGKVINTSGVHEFSFMVETVDGQPLVFRELGYLSDAVSSPLLSFGRLFQHGWTIGSHDGLPSLHHAGKELVVPLNFKNASLVLEGNIRHVHEVRAVLVDVPQSWHGLRFGWHSTSTGLPICRSDGTKFVDPMEEFVMTQFPRPEFPYRTTLGLTDAGWKLVKMCEPIFGIENLSAPMEGYKGALTILSRDVVSAEGLGFCMATEHRAGGDVDGQAEAKPALSDSECLLSPNRQGIQVAGVPLNKQSSIASLRAACKYLGISQAGSKLKLFDRLVQHADKLRLQVLQKLATEYAEPLGQPMPKQQPLHAEPSPEERALHEVNHLPYASWCESCVMAKGRPEPHTSDPEHLTRREHSVLSFDFSFTGRDPSVLPCLGGVVAPEDKQTVLNVYDSHSGCVFAIPVPLRRDVHFMCPELMKILQFLGYSKVVLRCDAEPVLMKVQSLLQTARQKLSLETLLENGRVRDPGSNA